MVSVVLHAADPSDATADDDEEAADPLTGPFCCQNGQGLGYSDPDDVGGSCFPSSKPKPGTYCDSVNTCGSDCNGTWVLGFCGYNTSADGRPSSADVCETALYGPKSLRAAQSSFCDSEAACEGTCNGTWCHYVKEYVG